MTLKPAPASKLAAFASTSPPVAGSWSRDMTKSTMTWPVCSNLAIGILYKSGTAIRRTAEHGVNTAGNQEGDNPAQTVVAQPGVGEETAEPGGLGGGADGGEAEAQDNRHGPGTESTPFDAAAIPVGAGRTDVQQVLGAVVLAMHQVDHEDPDPGGDRYRQQRNEGDERAVEAV